MSTDRQMSLPAAAVERILELHSQGVPVNEIRRLVNAEFQGQMGAIKVLGRLVVEGVIRQAER